MFKKLKHRLLLMNLIIMSLLLFLSLSSVYMLTYNKTYADIDMELERIILISQHKPPAPDFKFENAMKTIIPLFLMPDRNMAFGIDLTSDGKIASIQSFFNEDETFYNSALDQVNQSNQMKGLIHLDNSIWSFVNSKNPAGSRIVFLDVTARLDVLNRFLITFVMSYFVAVAVIVFISAYLTQISIQPIVQAFERQKRFISDASHELKTPLTVIGSNLDVLLSHGEKLSEQDLKWLNYIKSETSRMTRLTNDLLYLTQIESPLNTPTEAQSFDLSQLVEQIVLSHEAIAFEKVLSLHFKIEPHLMILGHPEKMNQVVLILLDNAMKYTPKNGVIIVSLTKMNSHLHLTVSNSGPGIPEHLTERIFDRFYRLDDARSRDSDSYGLGLSIARAIIEQHSGKISCDSLPEEMTTFTVKLKSINL